MDTTEVINDITIAESLIDKGISAYVKLKADEGLSDSEADAHYDEVSARIKQKIQAARDQLKGNSNAPTI